MKRARGIPVTAREWSRHAWQRKRAQRPGSATQQHDPLLGSWVQKWQAEQRMALATQCLTGGRPRGRLATRACWRAGPAGEAGGGSSAGMCQPSMLLLGGAEAATPDEGEWPAPGNSAGSQRRKGRRRRRRSQAATLADRRQPPIPASRPQSGGGSRLHSWGLRVEGRVSEGAVQGG